MNKKYMTLFSFIIVLPIIALINHYLQKNQNISLSNNSQNVFSSDLLEYIPSGEIFLSGEDNESTNTFETFSYQSISKNIIDYTSLKAVYASGWIAGGTTSRQAMIQSMNDYGFNSVVLDIKDEAGHVSYSSTVPIVNEISSSKNMIHDISAVIKEFHDNGIYVIGRIVTFKDPTYAKAMKQISYLKEDGNYWTDKSGNYWPNPYNKESWNYPIALAKEAVELGFDEIQFDYVRFPSSEGRVKQINYGFDSDTVSKSQIINQFLTTVMDELSDYPIKVSADVFGITTKRDGDFENIGQDYKAIANIVDIICPMTYPSHYGKGEYGVAKPDLDPYTIIYKALHDAQERVSGDSSTAIVRPYLQDFTATWLGKGNYQTYGKEAVSKQIQACSDLGINTFTLWDPSNKYCYEALELINKTDLSGEQYLP